MPVRGMMALIKAQVAPATISEDLSFLRQIGLVEFAGFGRGARWYLKGQQPPS